MFAPAARLGEAIYEKLAIFPGKSVPINSRFPTDISMLSDAYYVDISSKLRYR